MMMVEVEVEEDNEEKSTVEEQKRIGHLRATLHKKDDPFSNELDDGTLRRFLLARDLNVEKASCMVTKYLAWSRAFTPKGSISESEIPNQIAQNKLFMQGKDKQGRPIAVLVASSHFPTKGGGLEEFKRYVVFVLDKLCRSNPHGKEKFTIISDLQGFGYCNTDVRGSLAALTILQDYYPERLGKVFNIHAPYIFMRLWKIICPFMDKNTRKKIVFAENTRVRETLLEDIDESQLPEMYGGKMPLVPIHLA